jgi:hypothetical protein
VAGTSNRIDDDDDDDDDDDHDGCGAVADANVIASSTTS